MNSFNINFRKAPYNGVFTKVANSEGCTPQNVRMLYHNNNPKYVELVNIELNRIHANLRRKKKLNAEALAFS